MLAKWAELQIGHKAWINRDDDGRVVLPREIVRTLGMKDRTKARTLYIQDVDDLAAAAGPKTQGLIKKGAKAVLLLFSEMEEIER